MLNIKNMKELNELVEVCKDEERKFNVDKLIEKSVFEKNNTTKAILNDAKLRIQIEYISIRLELNNIIAKLYNYKFTEEEEKDVIKLINCYNERIEIIVKAIQSNEQDYLIDIYGQKEINEVQALAEQRINDLTEKYGIKVTKLDCYVYALKFNDTKDFIIEEMKDLYDIDNTHIFWDFTEKYAEIYWNERVDWIDLKQLKMKLSITRTYEEKNDLLVQCVDFMMAHEYGHLIVDKYDLLNNKELQHIYYSVHHRGFREYAANNMEEFLADCIAYSVLDKEDRLKVADTFINKIDKIVCK